MFTGRSQTSVFLVIWTSWVFLWVQFDEPCLAPVFEVINLPLKVCLEVVHVPVAGIDAYVICVLCALAWQCCRYLVHIQNEEKWTEDAALGCSCLF